MIRRKSPKAKNNKSSSNDEAPTINYDLVSNLFIDSSHSGNKMLSYENESLEALHEKLQIKSEALNLLGKQLELSNREKLEYKQLIDVLYDKNLALKKSLYLLKENNFDNLDIDENNLFNLNSKTKSSSNLTSINTSKSSAERSISPLNSINHLINDIDSDEYVKILKDLIKTLQKEKYEVMQKYEDVKQELDDSRNDLRLLREQIARQRSGILNEGLTTSIQIDSIMSEIIQQVKQSPKSSSSLLNNNTFIPSSLSCCTISTNSTSTPQNQTSNNINNNTSLEREKNLLRENEKLREKNTTLENEMKILQCELEEAQSERDAFKQKQNELNRMFLDKINRDGDNNSELKINNFNLNDLLNENKKLNDLNDKLTKELNDLKTASARAEEEASKESNINNSASINKTHIKNLLVKAEYALENYSAKFHLGSQETQDLVRDLKTLVEQMLEALNDKTIANKNQRKVNKLLAIRVQDLEKQLLMFNSGMDKDEKNIFNPISKSSGEDLHEISNDLNKSLIKFDEPS